MLLPSGSGELAVIGDEGMGAGEPERLPAHHLLDHGVAPLIDHELVGSVDFGAAIVPLSGEGRPTGKDIDFGQCFGGLAQFIGPIEDGGDQVFKECLLAAKGVALRFEYFAFPIPEHIGGEALGIFHGLPPGVVFRHIREVAFRHFNEVTESAVVTDAEVFDAGAFLLRELKLREPLLAVTGEAAKMVELRIKAVANRPAVFDLSGGFVGQSVFQGFCECVKGVNSGGDISYRGAGKFEQMKGDSGQGTESVTDPAEFARVAQAVLQAPEDSLDVSNAFE